LSLVACEEHEWAVSKRADKTNIDEMFLFTAFILIACKLIKNPW
jgi:hypothetical protein